MRKIVVSLVLVALAVLAPAAGARAPTPTLTLEEYCPVVDGQQGYGALASLSGFPPNTSFFGSLQIDGSGASGDFTTDEFGNFSPTGFALLGVPAELATATVTWSGGTLVQTLRRPCQGPPLPTAKPQCKKNGYVAFGFKNQGDCVSFIATGGRNQPAPRSPQLPELPTP